MNDDIRACQVQSGSAGLERDQKDRGIIRIEFLYPGQSLFLGRRAGDLIIGDLLFVQFHLQKLQHLHELREDQRLVLAAHDTAHKFHARLFFD